MGKIYIVTYKSSLNEYLFHCDEDLIPIFKDQSHPDHLVISFIKRVISHFFHIYIPRYFDVKSKKMLKKICPEDKLICFIEEPWDAEYLSSHVNTSHLIIYLWNSVLNRSSIRDQIAHWYRLGFDVYTFDKSDAIKYRLKFNNQFYKIPKRYGVSNLRNSSNISIKYGFYFLGRNKNREDILLKMQQNLSVFGECKFIILGSNYNVRKEISYKKNLEFITESEVLIDIVQNGQSGLTIRTMESLFFGKKLISNNKEIKNTDFYDENNIFIWDKDTNNTQIAAFLAKTYRPISMAILQKYTVEVWLKRFV